MHGIRTGMALAAAALLAVSAPAASAFQLFASNPDPAGAQARSGAKETRSPAAPAKAPSGRKASGSGAAPASCACSESLAFDATTGSGECQPLGAGDAASQR